MALEPNPPEGLNDVISIAALWSLAGTSPRLDAEYVCPLRFLFGCEFSLHLLDHGDDRSAQLRGQMMHLSTNRSDPAQRSSNFWAILEANLLLCYGPPLPIKRLAREVRNSSVVVG